MQLEITNLGKHELIPSDLQPLLDTFMTTVRQRYTDRCAGIYLTGSACTGRFRKGQSDLDIYTVVYNDVSPDDLAWFHTMSVALAHEFPIVTKIDAKVYEIQTLQLNPLFEGDRIVFKTEGLLLWGTDVLSDYQPPQTFKDLARALASERFRVIPEVHARLSSHDDPARLGLQLSKQFVRLVYYVVLAQGVVHYTPVFVELRELARQHAPGAFQEHLLWAEQLAHALPATFAELQAVYDEGMRRLEAFKAALG